jgi:hypothetical protein
LRRKLAVGSVRSQKPRIMPLQTTHKITTYQRRFKTVALQAFKTTILHQLRDEPARYHYRKTNSIKTVLSGSYAFLAGSLDCPQKNDRQKRFLEGRTPFGTSQNFAKKILISIVSYKVCKERARQWPLHSIQ